MIVLVPATEVIPLVCAPRTELVLELLSLDMVLLLMMMVPPPVLHIPYTYCDWEYPPPVPTLMEVALMLLVVPASVLPIRLLAMVILPALLIR